MNEFVIAPFAQIATLTTEPSCVCLIELKTELTNLNNFYAAHSNKTTEVRNIRIHVFLFFLTQTTKRSCSQFNLEPVIGRNGISNSQTTVNCDSTYFTWHPICI